MKKPSDKLIVNCAERMVEKLKSGECRLYNGEFLPQVKQEIDRMIALCTFKEIV